MAHADEANSSAFTAEAMLAPFPDYLTANPGSLEGQSKMYVK